MCTKYHTVHTKRFHMFRHTCRAHCWEQLQSHSTGQEGNEIVTCACTTAFQSGSPIQLLRCNTQRWIPYEVQCSVVQKGNEIVTPRLAAQKTRSNISQRIIVQYTSFRLSVSEAVCSSFCEPKKVRCETQSCELNLKRALNHGDDYGIIVPELYSVLNLNPVS